MSEWTTVGKKKSRTPINANNDNNNNNNNNNNNKPHPVRTTSKPINNAKLPTNTAKQPTNNSRPTNTKQYKNYAKQPQTQHNYHYIDLNKVESAPAGSIFLLLRPTASDYLLPSTTKVTGVAPLRALALKTFVSELQDNPWSNIPALMSVPDEYRQKILSFLEPGRVEVRVALHDYQFRNNNTKNKEPIRLISLRKVVESIAEYERRFLAYQNHMNPKQSLSTLEPNLIDVWAHYDTFKMRPITSEEDGIFSFYFGARVPYRPPAGSLDEPSLANRETFMNRFHVFTHGMFEGWKGWSNMIIVGGAVQACLVRVPEKYAANDESLFDWYHRKRYMQSDIDICFYGLTDEQWARKIFGLYKFLSRDERVVVVRTRFTATFCLTWPRRHIQIVLSKWDSIQEIIQESDVDCSAVAFDGTRVWTTQRGRLSYNYRAIVATQKSYQSRGNPEYEGRLMKYSRRGFYIWDMDFSFRMLSNRLLDRAKEALLRGELEITGLGLLLCGLKFSKEIQQQYELNGEVMKKVHDMFKDKDVIYKDTGLPYGPYWTLRRIEMQIKHAKLATDDYGYIQDNENAYAIANVRSQDSIVVFGESPQHSMRSRTRPTTINPRNFLLNDEQSADDYIWWNMDKDKMMTATNLGLHTTSWHHNITIASDEREILAVAPACRMSVIYNTGVCDHEVMEYCICSTGGAQVFNGIAFVCANCFAAARNTQRTDNKYIYKLKPENQVRLGPAVN